MPNTWSFQRVQGAAVAAGPTSRRCGEFKGTTQTIPQKGAEKAAFPKEAANAAHSTEIVTFAGPKETLA